MVFGEDGAGLQFTWKLIASLRSALIGSGLEMAVVELPTGTDPDGLIRSHCPDALRRPIEQSRHWLPVGARSAPGTPQRQRPSTCRCSSAVRPRPERCWLFCHQGHWGLKASYLDLAVQDLYLQELSVLVHLQLQRNNP